MKRCLFLLSLLGVILSGWPTAYGADAIWDLQAVNASGVGNHPKVGADIGSDPAHSTNRVSVTGIALNGAGELLDPTMQWQICVQGESPDKGGIAAWDGAFFGGDWPRHPADIEPGDRIRIDGFIEDHNGKVIINARHSAAPEMQFVVTKLASDAGMPTPLVIPNIAACNTFDQTRATGGEHYQGQWVRLNAVHIVSGTWSAGSSLVVADDAGSTLTMLLSETGDFARYPAPSGNFSLQGIFDQEDPTPPATDNYRVWIKHYSDIAIPSGLLDSLWDLQAVDANGVGNHPKVGADIGSDPATSANRVHVVGIALNRPDELLDPAQQWQVFIQAQWPEKGGIAAWDGAFFGGSWPRHPADIEPGDLIQIDGFVEDHNGKVNINARHSSAPEMQFVVTKLASGVGLPTPKEFTSLADVNAFDITRKTGGERYQCTWVKFKQVRIVSGTWKAGNTLVIADDGGSTTSLLLSSQGDFDQHAAPTGTFSVTGIYDQEDAAAPATGDYRLWVKRFSDFEFVTGAKDWELYR